MLHHHVNVKQPEWTRQLQSWSRALGLRQERTRSLRRCSCCRQVLGGGKTEPALRFIAGRASEARQLRRCRLCDRLHHSGRPTEFSNFRRSRRKRRRSRDAGKGGRCRACRKSKPTVSARKPIWRAPKALLKAESTYSQRDAASSGIARIMGWIIVCSISTAEGLFQPLAVEKVDAVTAGAGQLRHA